MQETQVQSLGGEDPLEEEMATHSSILARRIPWTEEPGGLRSMGSQKSMRSQRFMGSQRDTTEPMSTFPWVAMRRPGHAWSYRKRREPAGVHQSPGSLSHKVQEAERWMLSGWRSIKSSIPVVLRAASTAQHLYFPGGAEVVP